MKIEMVRTINTYGLQSVSQRFVLEIHVPLALENGRYRSFDTDEENIIPCVTAFCFLSHHSLGKSVCLQLQKGSQIQMMEQATAPALVGPRKIRARQLWGLLVCRHCGGNEGLGGWVLAVRVGKTTSLLRPSSTPFTPLFLGFEYKLIAEPSSRQPLSQKHDNCALGRCEGNAGSFLICGGCGSWRILRGSKHFPRISHTKNYSNVQNLLVAIHIVLRV